LLLGLCLKINPQVDTY